MKKIALFIAIIVILLSVTGCKKEEERKKMHEDILKKLSAEKIIEDDWVYVGDQCTWGYESSDCSHQYYFYIDQEKYEQYKNYWLEDVEISKDLNADLSENGEDVFYGIYISETTDQSTNQTQYHITVYDRSLYYKYVIDYKEDKGYAISSNYKCEKENISRKFVMYLENNEWVIEEESEVNSDNETTEDNTDVEAELVKPEPEETGK